MRIIIATFLIIISILGSIFFNKYKGNAISSPWLWQLFFVFIGLVGVSLFTFSYMAVRKKIDKVIDTHKEQLKAKAEKIQLNFDFCEFKNAGYNHLVRDENISALNLMAPTSAASMHNPTKNERVLQSYLIYNYTGSFSNQKYVSEYFPVDETTLKYYVLSGRINLYINKFNPKEYIFELDQ